MVDIELHIQKLKLLINMSIEVTELGNKVLRIPYLLVIFTS